MKPGSPAPPAKELKYSPLTASPRQRLSARTHELAMRAGRTPVESTRADYEQAKRDVTGETDRDRQDAILDAIPPLLRPIPSDGEREATT